jgi:hypothetical protein
VPVATSGASATYAVTTVPGYEDWYATETFFACSSCSTGAASLSSVTTFAIQDDSSAIHSAVSVTSTASGTLTTVTPDAGEYEGKRIAAGSTLAFVIAGGSSSVPIGSARMELRGYIRYINSTRSEG